MLENNQIRPRESMGEGTSGLGNCRHRVGGSEKAASFVGQQQPSRTLGGEDVPMEGQTGPDHQEPSLQALPVSDFGDSCKYSRLSAPWSDSGPLHQAGGLL